MARVVMVLWMEQDFKGRASRHIVGDVNIHRIDTQQCTLHPLPDRPNAFDAINAVDAVNAVDAFQAVVECNFHA